MSTDQRTKFGRKRQRQEDDDQPNKRQTHRKVAVKPAVQLQITDVNNDCLMEVFKHLSWVDLLNVADTNKRFRILAGMEWTHRLNGRFVEFGNVRPYRGLRRMIEVNTSVITVRDLKSCLQLLRCFGDLIEKLNLECNETAAEHRMKIEKYLSKYSSKTLDVLWVTSPRLFYGISKPFSMGQIAVSNCHLQTTFSFAKLFPKMFCLWLESVKFPWRFADKIPHLKHLTITNVDESFVKEFLLLNRQLTFMTLYSNCGPAFIQFISSHLSNLETLSLSVSPNDFADDGHDMYHFETLLFFFVHAKHLTSSLGSFPFSFGKLIYLWVSNLRLNQNTLNSLGKISSLKTLSLTDLKDEENLLGQLLQLENVLKNVRELDIDLKTASSECVRRFLEQSESIQRFGYFSNDEIIEEMRSELEVKWKIEKSGNKYFLVKK